MKTTINLSLSFKLCLLLFIMCFSSILIKAQNPHRNHFGGYYEVWNLENDGNYIWASTSKDLIKLDQNENIIKRYSYDGGMGSGSILSIAIDKNGEPWFGFDYSGIFHLYDSTWIELNNFPSESPEIIQFDTLNRIWILNYEGIWFYNGTNWINYNSTNSSIPSSCSMYDIKIDNNNNVWIATSLGLVKFDGNNWSIYNTSNSGIQNNYISAIAFDSSNNIWMIAEGLTTFDGTNWTNYNNTNSSLPPSLESDVFFIDNNNHFWFNLYYQGVAMFDGINYYTYDVTNSSLLHNRVGSITQDNSGRMYFATLYAITIFDGTNWQNINSSNYPNIGCNVNSIKEDSHGNIWFTNLGIDTIINAGGVYKYNDTTFTYFNKSNSGLPSNRVFDVEEDLQGKLWFCTDSGICCFDGNIWTTFNVSNSGIANNYVSCMAIDSNGNKWFGTYSGLSFYNNLSWITYNSSNSPFQLSYINSIAVDYNNNIWIGSGSPIDGLIRYNGSWTSYNISNSGLIDNIINSVTIDNSGNILIGYGGPFASRFNGTSWTTWDQTNSSIPPSTFINDIKMDIAGNLWFLIYLELIKFDGITWKNFNSYNSSIVYASNKSLLIDSKGRKWIVGNGITLFTESNLLYNKYKISGKVYFDENGNGIKDLAEVYLEGQKMRLLPDTTFTLTNCTENYNFYVDSGNYTVQYIPQNPWQLSACQGTFNVSVSNNDITIPDIGVLSPDTTLFNIDVTLLGSTCNTPEALKISYINNGNTLNGLVGFIPDTLVQFMQSTPVADSVSINGIYWYHFSNLLPGEEGQIWVQLMMPDFTAMGDTMMFTAFVQSNGSNFVDTTYEINTCSFDPNEKSVWPKGILSEHYTLKTDPLEYTIRFQNTGNAPATNIIITDTLSPWLDINSFEFISTSHTTEYNLTADGKLIFYFNNILLSDSCANEQASHGYVKFKICAKSNIPENTVINNTANIFFDYNPPIITNTVFNTMVTLLPVGIVSQNISTANSFIIYPNPTKGTFNIKNINTSFEIDIYNYLGEKVYHEKSTSQKNTFNINTLTKGIYLVKINTEKQWVSKLIIE